MNLPKLETLIAPAFYIDTSCNDVINAVEPDPYRQYCTRCRTVTEHTPPSDSKTIRGPRMCRLCGLEKL